MKIGVVVQRYGEEVLGGSESLCREISRRLGRRGYEVTVFTTCARDYVTWANEYPPGETESGGVRIRRFASERQRDIRQFNAFSEDFFRSGTGNPALQEEWIDRQGPYCPALLKALERADREMDLFLFFTYLYYPVVKGIRVVTRPAFLFPTAHDEPPLYLPVVREVFVRPRGLFFLTRAEMEFVRQTFRLPAEKLILSRTGIETVEPVPRGRFRERYALPGPYLLYAGRIEKGKGLDTLFEGFRRLEKPSDLTLALIGKKLMEIPAVEGIRYLGFVPDRDKLAGFRDALFSVQPSALESLSITTLESWSQRTPVLVNGQSAVLREHVESSRGGRIYRDVEDFTRQAARMIRRGGERNRMGRRGHRYVRRNYAWEPVMQIITRHIGAPAE